MTALYLALENLHFFSFSDSVCSTNWKSNKSFESFKLKQSFKISDSELVESYPNENFNETIWAKRL